MAVQLSAPERTKRPRLSCVVVVYNMRREAERTLFSLSSAYQRDVSADEYEVIVVENGSRDPIDEAYVGRFGENFRLLTVPDASQSPAPAINLGAEHARGDIIVSMIDGARMVSPGCIAWTLRAFDLFPDAAAIVPSWHLGPDVQNESVLAGYNQAIEDELLQSVDWRSDGYELFRLCERLDPSSEGSAWFGAVTESNFIAVSRDTFERLNGFDEAFTSRGGGAVNLDFFRRIAEGSGCRVVSLLGEATFHQFHGGVSTNVKSSEHPWAAISEEYSRIRGVAWATPVYTPVLLGALSPQGRDLLARTPNIFTCARRKPRAKAWLARMLSFVSGRHRRHLRRLAHRTAVPA